MNALAQLEALENLQKAEDMSKYHKQTRRVLGVSNPQIDALVREWRAENDVAGRVALADELWQSDIFEARIAAPKLLIQARLRPDDGPAWQLIASWVPQFDSWAIADHAASAGARRLLADPSRLEQVAQWTQSDHLWSRRAALVMTLPWAKFNNPSEQQSQQREQILSWAAEYTSDQQWFIQKAIAWWLRDLSKHDADRVRSFLDTHGETLKPFARKEASKYLK